MSTAIIALSTSAPFRLILESDWVLSLPSAFFHPCLESSIGLQVKSGERVRKHIYIFSLLSWIEYDTLQAIISGPSSMKNEERRINCAAIPESPIPRPIAKARTRVSAGRRDKKSTRLSPSDDGIVGMRPRGPNHSCPIARPLRINANLLRGGPPQAGQTIHRSLVANCCAFCTQREKMSRPNEPEATLE
jgi:hypothetical protein